MGLVPTKSHGGTGNPPMTTSSCYTNVSRLALQGEYEPESGVHGGEQVTRDSSPALGQVSAIQRDDLRDVRHRILRKAGLALWYEDVPRGVQELEVRCQDHRDGRRDPAAIEGIGLYDQHRAPEPWLGAARLTQVSPPDLASLNYHSDRAATRRCARRVRSSSWLGSEA